MTDHRDLIRLNFLMFVVESGTRQQKMTSSRDGVCLCTMGSHLIAVGGINGPSYLRSAEIYDSVNNTWEIVASMETCRAAAGVAVIAQQL